MCCRAGKERRRPSLRGIANGELRADVDLDVVIDALYGPIWYRILVPHAPLTSEWAGHLADYVFDGLRPAAADVLQRTRMSDQFKLGSMWRCCITGRKTGTTTRMVRMPSSMMCCTVRQSAPFSCEPSDGLTDRPTYPMWLYRIDGACSVLGIAGEPAHAGERNLLSDVPSLRRGR